MRGKRIANTLLIVLGLLSLIACGGGSEGNETSSLVHLKQFEDGSLFRTNSSNSGNYFNVLDLHGSYHEMGRQYGALLKVELQNLYHRIMSGAAGRRYAEVEQAAFALYEKYPNRFREIIQGMAETSGLSLEQQVILNLGILIIAEGEAGCSGLGIWDDYSTNGRMVFGRNWDLNKGLFTAYAPYLTVVVYNPDDGSNSVADINYMGTFVFQTGMNSRGIFMDFQNGAMADSGDNPSAPDSNTALFSFLFDQRDMEGITRAFEATPSEGGAIVNVASANAAYSFEWPHNGVKRRQPDRPGVLAATNHFVDPSWMNLPSLPADPLHRGYTIERRENLLARAEEYKGAIDAAQMMSIFETTIPNGGPTFSDDTPGIQTYYQLVALPSEQVLYLKALGFSGWERIDLAQLFQ